MRVAILGGTGSFGRALAGRLVALGEDDIVIGSRDEARARETAAELGGARVTGATNEDAVAGVDLVVLAVKADAALDTARGVAGALGTTPLLSVASAIEFRKGVGMVPDPDALSLAERVQDVVDAPVVAGLHSIAAANLEARSAGRGRADLRRRPRREGARARVRRQARRRPRARRRPARERPRARGADRRDREPEPPLQGARRRAHHRRRRRRVISLIPVRGLPEIREGDDLAALIVRADRARGRRRARDRAEGGLEGRGPGDPDRLARGVARTRSSSPATSATRARSRSSCARRSASCASEDRS